METDLHKIVSLELPLSHLIVIRELLANKIAGSPYIDEFSEVEKRAIWAFEDLCNNEIVKNIPSENQPGDWEKHVDQAMEAVKLLSVDCTE